MEYFTIKRFLFLVPSNDCYEELEKIDKFINLLNKSGIGKIIEKEQKEEGRIDKYTGNIKEKTNRAL